MTHHQLAGSRAKLTTLAREIFNEIHKNYGLRIINLNKIKRTLVLKNNKFTISLLL